jgi:Baseplate J-like protein
MTAVSPSNIPISVDYTSKDYYSIREELIARIQSRMNEAGTVWTAADPADFGVALVEAFAYMGDLISFYIDRSANESFISTATQRASVLNIAQTYGYIPAGYRQAFTTLQFINNSNTEVTIPAGSVVSGDVVIGDTVQTVYFTTDADCVIIEKIGGAAGSQNVSATEGRSVTLVSDTANAYGELIGTSSGSPSSQYELGETPVVDGSIEIYVQDGDVYSKWEQVQHLLDAGPTDLVFEVTSDENDRVLITFGDGISGQIPVRFSEIRAKYIVGGGSIGNVSTGVLTTISYLPGLTENQTTAIQSGVTVTNTEVAIGGSNPESLDQIRISAPLSLRANNRAVTLQDFADLALGVSGVGKASAAAEIWTSVTVYIAPSRVATDTDRAPGLDDAGDPTVEYDTLKSDVELQLSDKTLLGTTVTIQPPTYVDAIITLAYTKLNQYTTTEVETAIKSSLLTNFGYTGMNFQDTIYPQDIEFVLQQVSGVKTIRVTVLHRQGGSGLNTLVGEPNEIFRFLEENISIGSI